MDMNPAELGTAMQLWKDLARVEQAIRIESAFEALLVRQVALVEHCSHEVALFDADPVLTGQYSTNFDAELEDIGTKGLGTLDLAGIVGVIENKRMEVPVAGMEDVRDREPVLLRKCPHPREDLGEAGARDRAVHAVIVGRDPPDSGKGSFAPGPKG
jgi:hypothetical protein